MNKRVLLIATPASGAKNPLTLPVACMVAKIALFVNCAITSLFFLLFYQKKEKTHSKSTPRRWRSLPTPQHPQDGMLLLTTPPCWNVKLPFVRSLHTTSLHLTQKRKGKPTIHRLPFLIHYIYIAISRQPGIPRLFPWPASTRRGSCRQRRRSWAGRHRRLVFPWRLHGLSAQR